METRETIQNSEGKFLLLARWPWSSRCPALQLKHLTTAPNILLPFPCARHRHMAKIAKIATRRTASANGNAGIFQMFETLLFAGWPEINLLWMLRFAAEVERISIIATEVSLEVHVSIGNNYLTLKGDQVQGHAHPKPHLTQQSSMWKRPIFRAFCIQMTY